MLIVARVEGRRVFVGTRQCGCRSERSQSIRYARGIEAMTATRIACRLLEDMMAGAAAQVVRDFDLSPELVRRIVERRTSIDARTWQRFTREVQDGS